MSSPSDRSLHKSEKDDDSFGHDIHSTTSAREDESVYELSDYIDRRPSSHSMFSLELYPGAERIDYDFTSERRSVNHTNIFESTSHLIKGCLGAGILSMHEGYMRGGLWASLAATFVIGSMVPYNMSMLVSSAHKLYVRLRVPKLTYPDVVEAAVATGPLKCCRKHCKKFRYVIETCLFVDMCGTCCIYQIMIAETLKLTLEHISPEISSWNMTIRMYILIVLVPLFIICIIRNLKYLAPFSLAADLLLGICIITTLYYSFSNGADIMDRPAFKSFRGLLQFCGILMYSLDGVGVTLPIENNMAKPQHFYTVLQFGMSIVLVAITLVGFCGYWGFGENCRSPFTIQMPMQTVSIILEFLVVIILAVTFGLNFWVTFRIVWHYISRRHKKISSRRRAVLERIYRAIFLMLITGLSVVYPNMVRLMIFLGVFFLSIISFMFPALIETLVTWKEHKKGRIRWRFVKNLFIFMFGTLLNICGFYSTI